MRILFITDIHIRSKNIAETETLIDKLRHMDRKYDFAVIGGDILDTHERVDVQMMNRAYELISVLKSRTVVYICVGNHDMINNQQFLTQNHWMNGMKEWSNVVVVDTPVKSGDFIFVPYVPPGRFVEALDTIDAWKNARCIFAHQEFKGCKLGVIKSVEGDEWDLEWPLVISGHIHDRHKIQSNVKYPGSFKPIIFDFDTSTEEHIPLGIKIPKSIQINAVNVAAVDVAAAAMMETTNVIVDGTIEELASFRNGQVYKNMISKGANVKFRVSPPTTMASDASNKKSSIEPVSFAKILFRLVTDTDDRDLIDDYNLLI